MKKQLAFTGIALIAMTMGQTAFAEFEPTVVQAGYHTGYIPEGFDTNDNIQVVGEGMFPNTCYKPATPKVDVNHDLRTITIQPQAYQYGGFCLQVLLPWDQEINLGLLKAGRYQIVQKGLNGAAQGIGEVNVRTATNATADDFLYAPITQAYYEKKGDKNLIKLTGVFSNSCMKVVDVMVSVQSKVIVVQPISELQEPTATRKCEEGYFPFERQVELRHVNAGRYLLHVRSLNAKTVNNLIDVQ